MDDFVNSLPIPLLKTILSKLPSRDIFIARSVCKKWLYVVDYYLKIDDLILFLNVAPQCSDICFFTNDLVLSDRSFFVQNLDFLHSRTVKIIFNRLKRLIIFGTLSNDEQYDLRKLECTYRQLEHLEFYNLKLKQLERVINLPCLKILSFKRSTINDPIVRFYAPKLNSIRFTFMRDDYLVRTDCVKYIQAKQYHTSILNYKNLEILKLDEINGISTNFLLNFCKLKEILFFTQNEIYHELKRQKNLFRMNQLSIYFLGIKFDELNHKQMIEINKINDRHYLDNDYQLELYFNHFFDLNDHIPFIKKVNYIKLFKIANSKFLCTIIPKQFFTIFSSLHTVIVNDQIIDQDSFIDFLNHCKCLNRLVLINSKLDNYVFNQLPLLLNPLNHLEISDTNCNQTQLNIDFILKLKYLISLSIRNHISFDSADLILKQCKHLKSFYFKNLNDQISIVKKSSSFFESTKNQYTLGHNSLENLIRFLKSPPLIFDQSNDDDD